MHDIVVSLPGSGYIVLQEVILLGKDITSPFVLHVVEVQHGWVLHSYVVMLSWVLRDVGGLRRLEQL